MSQENEEEQVTLVQLNYIRAHLKMMLELGGSDLHIKANSRIRYRGDGSIKVFEKSTKVYPKENALMFAKELLKGRFAEFTENRELDLVYPYDAKSRFRVNIFYQMDGISAVFRVIPVEIPTMEALNLPSILKKFIEKERGLVLVTGVTGSGKSTTLASIINEINQLKPKHIITIEDPIEFVHKDKSCIVNQRSVGQDTLSFGGALRAALREDPDIILVGEMRDRETINLALHAADTGHLVFSTLHTIDAKETINRIISTFPTEEQSRVRMALSGVIQGIISQRLVPTVEKGRRAAMEILVSTPTIEQLIAENRDYEIKDAIESGREHYGSQSFDQHLLELYKDGVISKEKAKDYATSATDLELKMSGMTSASDANSTGDSPTEAINFENDEDVIDLK